MASDWRTRSTAERVADLRDRTDDERYAMLVWLAREHPAMFDDALEQAGQL